MKGEREGDFGIRWLSEITHADEESVGVEGVSLARLYQKKMLVPAGFILSKELCIEFIKNSGIEQRIIAQIEHLDKSNKKKVIEACEKIKEIFKDAKMDEKLVEELKEAYTFFDTANIFKSSKEIKVSVRSLISGKGSDAYNVESMIKSIIECYALSFGSEEWIKNADEKDIEKSLPIIIVHKSVNEEKRIVVYSRNPDNIEEMVVEALVSGIMPDKYVIDRNLEKLNLKEIKTFEKDKILDNYLLKRMALYAEEIEGIFKCPQKIEFALSKEGLHILSLTPLHINNNSKNKEEGKEKKVEEKPVALQSLDELVEEVLKVNAIQVEKEWESYEKPETMMKLFQKVTGKKPEKEVDAPEMMDKIFGKIEEDYEKPETMIRVFGEIEYVDDNADYEEKALKALE